MSVIKKTWKELLQANSNLNGCLNDQNILSQAEALDTAFSTKYGVATHVKQCIQDMSDDYLSTDTESSTELWEDLEIFMSSFKVKDRRPIIKIKDNLLRYLRFLTKMIADEGLTRKMIVSRNFDNNNTSSNTDKNVYSETPSLDIQTFEDAISYASNVSRNDNEGESHQSGASGETATNVNWDEALKNIQFAFYNEIVDYITSLPSELYNYYSLDSRPITELIKYTRKTLFEIYHL